MAQHKRELLEEGEHEFYIHNAAYYEGIRISAVKIGLAFTPRGKPVGWVYLHSNAYARLWAVILAEYYVNETAQWPSFATIKEVIAALNLLRRKKVQLTVKVKHRSMNGETFYSDITLLRPSS